MWYAATGENFTHTFTDAVHAFPVWRFDLRYTIGSLCLYNGRIWVSIQDQHGIKPGSDITAWREVEGCQLHVKPA